MKAKLAISFLALSSLAMVPRASLAAQYDDTQKKSDSTRTLTGCLSAGDKSGEYNLMADDGSTWTLTSKNAKLGDHVGHTVTGNGRVGHAGMHGAKEKPRNEINQNVTEHDNQSVT